MPKVAVIPGDGIGIDVTREAVKVLEAASDLTRADVRLDAFDHGAEKYLATGVTLPDADLERLKTYDAIYVGALGDPRVPDMAHARDILLGLRFKLDLYVNMRPIQPLHERLLPLRRKQPSDVDIVVFRENTEGAYVGVGGIFKKGTPDEIALQEDVNTRKGVERIVRHAFGWAKANGRRSVTMSDKSNALRHGHDLWQRVFAEVAREHADMPSSHAYVDALAMQLVLNPERFDVVVTCNMFGDILSDLGAALAGGLGTAASANLHPGRHAMFEPVHGSAPKYAGKDVANPIAAILTARLLLLHLGLREAGELVGKAVRAAIAEGATTRDLGGSLGTRAAGDDIVARMRALAR
jgi:3-isopropylmalate dehydrogenase